MNKVTKMELLRLEKEKALLIRSIILLKDKRDSLIGKMIGMINESKKKYLTYAKSQDELIKVFKNVFLKYNVTELRLDSLEQQSFFNVEREGNL